MAQCLHVKPTGELCKALPIKGEGYCYVHHPDYEERRRRAGSKGGKRGGRGRLGSELPALKEKLLNLADDVLAGEADRADAAVAGQLINYAIRAVTVELKTKEQEELQARLEALEELLEVGGGGRSAG